MAARADGAALAQPAATALQAAPAGGAHPAAAQAIPLAQAQAQVAVADRAAVAGALSTAPAAPAAPPPGASVATALAAPAVGNPQAANPTAMPVPAAPAAPLAPTHADARGNPMLAGGPAQGRADGVAQAHGHTVAATGRRSRLGDDPPGRGSGIAHALTLLGLGQARRKAEQDQSEQTERAFQRLYWLLTITACVCAGVMALVIALPMSDVFSEASPLLRHNPLAWIGILSAVGLGAALTAWWLARPRR